ncbi:MAG: host attachment protein [Alphaproteobacteria bacterium]|nr:host attachment protein [Alphaproteobacteria bacterium]
MTATLKKMNWILLADGGNARVMERVAPFGKLKEIFHLSHTHKASHELGNDKPGRSFESASPARHAYEPHSDPHELQKDNFAKEIVSMLKEAFQTQKFDELSIVSPPHMLGLLRSHLSNTPVHSRITKESDKNMLGMALEQIQDYIDNLPAKR